MQWQKKAKLQISSKVKTKKITEDGGQQKNDNEILRAHKHYITHTQNLSRSIHVGVL